MRGSLHQAVRGVCSSGAGNTVTHDVAPAGVSGQELPGTAPAGTGSCEQPNRAHGGLRRVGFRGGRSALRALRPHGSELEETEKGPRVPGGIHSPGGWGGHTLWAERYLNFKKKSFSHFKNWKSHTDIIVAL